MFICFRSDNGSEAIKVNSDGVIFCDGLAYFTDVKGNDYTIEIQYIVQILENIY